MLLTKILNIWIIHFEKHNFNAFNLTSKYTDKSGKQKNSII